MGNDQLDQPRRPALDCSAWLPAGWARLSVGLIASSTPERV
jgi:hypothetical protein